MSTFLQILRAIMSIMVFGTHLIEQMHDKVSVRSFGFYSKIEKLIPVVFASDAFYMCNTVFFSLSGFFAFKELHDIMDKYSFYARHTKRGNNVKLLWILRFITELALKYVKKYIHLRSYVFVNILAYFPILFYVFGSAGQPIAYSAPSAKCWMNIFSPFSVYQRIGNNSCTGAPTWFNYALMNIEWNFITMKLRVVLFFIVTNVISVVVSQISISHGSSTKIIKNNCYTIFEFIFLICIPYYRSTDPQLQEDFNWHIRIKYNRFYFSGIVLYYLRIFIVSNKFNLILSYRWKCIVFWCIFYVWLSLGLYQVQDSLYMKFYQFSVGNLIIKLSCLPIFIIITFDFVPKIHLNKLQQKTVSAILALRQPVQCIHFQFVHSEFKRPIMLPEVLIFSYNKYMKMIQHFTIIPMYFILILIVSYPQYIIVEPIDRLPNVMQQVIERKIDLRKLIKYIIRLSASILIIYMLALCNLRDKYGHAWGANAVYYVPKCKIQ